MEKAKRAKDELLMSIEENTDKSNMKHFAIMEYLLSNYKQVGYMTIENLSEALNSKDNEVLKYLNSIGYSSFENFRQEIRRVSTVELSLTERFQISSSMGTKINHVFYEVANKETDNIRKLQDTFQQDEYSAIISKLLQSPEVIVVGTRASSNIAIYAGEIFSRIGIKTTTIASGATEELNKVTGIDRNAVVLSFGFARYPKETVRILSFFKKRNFDILSITDSPFSPLVPFSTHSIIIPCESISFTDFFASPYIVINTLAISISQLEADKSLKSLREYEEISKDMGFFI